MEERIPGIEDKIKKKIDTSSKEKFKSKKLQTQNIQEIRVTIKRLHL